MLLLLGGAGPASITFPTGSDTNIQVYNPITGWQDITAEIYAVEVSRGRSRELDEINAGMCRLRTRNQAGNFGPFKTGGAYGDIDIGWRLVVQDNNITVFTGFIEDFEYEWRPGRFAEATIVAADGLARFARQKFEGDWTTTPFQTTGARLSSVMARPEVDDLWATLLFDTGLSTLQSDTVTHGTNVLNYCQQINRAEQGLFYVSGFGTLVFQDRESVGTGSPVLDFDATASGQVADEIPFSVVEVTFGSELLYTKVSVTIVGGSEQTADDLPSQANYGIRHLVLSNMLNDTDDEAADMASYLLNRYDAPEAVVSGIRVPLDTLSVANRDAVAGLEISDTVTLHWTPQGQSAVAQTLVVEGVGYEKSIDSATWMTFQLAAAPDNDFFILDNDSDNLAGADILDNDSDNQANAGILGF